MKKKTKEMKKNDDEKVNRTGKITRHYKSLADPPVHLMDMHDSLKYTGVYTRLILFSNTKPISIVRHGMPSVCVNCPMKYQEVTRNAIGPVVTV